MPDEIGGDKYVPKGQRNIRQDRAKVIACQRDRNDVYSFVFDNGQVWHQTDGRRFRKPGGCQFVAIITKDHFGYKMQVEGVKNQYRVRRIH